jgi:hypothetical protein
MVKSQCLPILDEISDIQSDIVTLQEDLAAAESPQEKNEITKKIIKLRVDLAKKQAEFDACEGIPPLPTPIQASMASRIIMATSDPRFPTLGPVSSTLTFTFSQLDFSVVAMGFPPTDLGTLTITIGPIAIGSNTITARVMSGGQGTYMRADNSLSIPTDFSLHHSAVGLSDSTFSMTLTTGTVTTSLPPGTLMGSPISRAAASAGRVALVGASVLTGSFAGTAVTAIISGTLTAFPP